VIVEAAERRASVGFVFAQRYRPARADGSFAVVGRPALLKRVPNRFGPGGCCTVFFHSGACTLNVAARALASYGLTVDWAGDQLIAHRRSSPQFRVKLSVGDQVRQEAAIVGKGTPYAAALGQCDACFDICFDNLEEALDEINTLMEVQGALQDASE